MNILILEKIGIQSWRLREPSLLNAGSEIVAEPEPVFSEPCVEPEVKQVEQADQINVAQLSTESRSVEKAAASLEPVIERVNVDQLDWPELTQLIISGTQCKSCDEHNSLLGSGSQTADWLFISDAPSSKEVAAGVLFDGRSGQLFEAMLYVLGLDRSKVYCSSIFKCAPTDDFSSSPQCEEWVYQQIRLVKPKVVVTFGEFVAQTLLKSNEPLARLRENTQTCLRSNITVIPTYSPREMLDDPGLKVQVWADLKKAMRLQNGH